MAPPRGLVVAALLLAAASPSAHSQQAVPVEVRILLQDPEGNPLPRTPVRVVLGAKDGPSADAGTLATTDEKGWARWTTTAAPERRQRKMPTNFTTQLLSSPQETVHFEIGVEQPWLGKPWVVVHSADRFPEGTTAQLDAPRVFGRAPDGTFSLEAPFERGTWRFPGVPVPFNTAGQRVTSLSIAPAGGGWTLQLAIQRAAEPVQR